MASTIAATPPSSSPVFTSFSQAKKYLLEHFTKDEVEAFAYSNGARRISKGIGKAKYHFNIHVVIATVHHWNRCNPRFTWANLAKHLQPTITDRVACALAGAFAPASQTAAPVFAPLLGATTPAGGFAPAPQTAAPAPVPGATTPAGGFAPAPQTAAPAPVPGATTPAGGFAHAPQTAAPAPVPGATTPAGGFAHAPQTTAPAPVPGATTPTGGFAHAPQTAATADAPLSAVTTPLSDEDDTEWPILGSNETEQADSNGRRFLATIDNFIKAYEAKEGLADAGRELLMFYGLPPDFWGGDRAENLRLHQMLWYACDFGPIGLEEEPLLITPDLTLLFMECVARDEIQRLPSPPLFVDILRGKANPKSIFRNASENRKHLSSGNCHKWFSALGALQKCHALRILAVGSYVTSSFTNSLISEGYGVKVFSPYNKPTQMVDKSTASRQKLDMLLATDTSGAKVLHSDRRDGSIQARDAGMSREAVRAFGLWERATDTQVYSKKREPKDIATGGGFRNEEKYFIPRSQVDPTTCADEGIKRMALSLWPKLDDEEFKKKIAHKASLRGSFASDTASRNASDCLRHLRCVFWQDLPFLYEIEPEHPIFSIQIIRENKAAFMRWVLLQQEVASQTIPEGSNMPNIDVLLNEHKALRIAQRSIQDSLNGLVKAVQKLAGLKDSESSPPEPSIPEATELYPINSLLDLGNPTLTVAGIWEEWYHGAQNSIAIRDAEKLRLEKKVPKHSSSSLNKKIMKYAQFIQYIQTQMEGGHDHVEAIAAIEEDRAMLAKERQRQVTCSKFFDLRVQGSRAVPRQMAVIPSSPATSRKRPASTSPRSPSTHPAKVLAAAAATDATPAPVGVPSCLGPGEWLNDSIIYDYMKLLQKRDRSYQTLPTKHLSCHFFHSHFMNALCDEEEQYNFERVRRWTSKRKLDTWGQTMANADKYFQILARYMADEHVSCGQPRPDAVWDFSIGRCTEQKNADDCGVYVCQFAKILSEDKTVENVEITHARNAMIKELTEGEIM
ncbi:hypothetical protein BSKO_13670 [Bryopsis sp. KO-2023]|nr:hypothetical protein BSKO_13670 [Bryopsis sp. KO-2023]